MRAVWRQAQLLGGLFGLESFEQSSGRQERAKYVDIWGDSVPGREKSKCKGPEVETWWYVWKARWSPEGSSLARNEEKGPSRGEWQTQVSSHGGPLLQMLLGADRHFSSLCVWQKPFLFRWLLSCPITQRITLFSQGLGNIFSKEPGSKYLGLWESFVLWCHNSTELTSTLWR